MSSDQQTASLPKSEILESTALAVIDWIDRELGETYRKDHGKGGDTLLELRRVFFQSGLNRMIGKFLSLRPRLEKSHYLLGYRIHVLLASQLQLRVSDPLGRTAREIHPLPRTRDSFDQIRRSFFEHADEIIPSGDIRLEVITTGDA